MSAQDPALHFAPPQSEVPAPPPGPGVAPPFAAPPRDRDNKSLWIGLGVGGLLLILCCVGGIFGVGLLASGSDGLVRSQATSVVTTYLDALRRQDYPQAYNQLCTDLTSKLSLEGFESRVSQPRVVAFSVDTVTISQDIVVDATVEREGRSPQSQSFPLVQSGTALKICGGV
jgi:hypothetical protein